MSQENTTKRNFKSTLNLPKTSFPMKANLVQNEPASFKRWEKADIYQSLRDANHPAGPFVFHDGPPYANGDIHLGHLLNKCLKDFVVRSHSMMGHDVPYIPGWDCHGLPIEHKVMQELGEAGKDLPPIKIRQKCKKYAEKFVKLQAGQMQRLLTLADYDNPYLTMNPGYEAAVLEVFADLVERRLVYRGLKPVHWSIDNQTALAEAELEYEDREDTSVFVLFDIHAGPERSEGSGIAPGQKLMIWTTTPWTLPANLAVAVSEQAEYGLYKLADGKQVWIACDLAEKVLTKQGGALSKPGAVVTGSDLVGTTYTHPFINRISPVVTADYVTLEDGTGLVHTAPGHGVEDYQTGLREGLDIYCPVKGDGTFDDTAPDWLQGKTVWQANDLVIAKLRESGHLFHEEKFTHSYPHDWRGKSPVIFRATEQWFVNATTDDKTQGRPRSLRDVALGAIESIDFHPKWGQNRMRGMLESRPDWCISRQRAWGLPIPAFYPPKGVEGQSLLTAASVRAVAKTISEKGSDAWFYMDAGDLLAHYDPASDPDAPEWAKSEIRNSKSEIKKSSDIFDVWFESGASWNACMKQRELSCPDDAPAHTDLYLEGSDQHRGWFQVSLLTSLGATGKPAFGQVLTHGFMVDKDGRKMSKSLGNALNVEQLLKQYGADVCRWWVSSLNTDNDIKVDPSYFKLAGEEYRKVRNTLRFLLSNLSDFDAAGDSAAGLEQVEATALDAWVLGELDRVIDVVTSGYRTFHYRRIHEAMFNFCNETLSSVYLAAVKDRLYCDATDSPRRCATQASLYTLTDALSRMLAPILPHTADEAWRALHGEGTCVHGQHLPTATGIAIDPAWPVLLDARDVWLRSLENARQANDIDNPLDCGLRVPAIDGVDVSKIDVADLADLCGVSRFAFDDSLDAVVVDDLRDEPRCERSWKRDGTVAQRDDLPGEYQGAMLSDRDAAAVAGSVG